MKPIYYVLIIVVLIAAALGAYKYFYAPGRPNISPTPTNTASPLAGTASPSSTPTTKEACEAANGEWVPLNRCILKTNDGGKACTDGSQCQGKVCVAEESSTSNIGKCTNYMTTTLGCYTEIENGKRGTSLCRD